MSNKISEKVVSHNSIILFPNFNNFYKQKNIINALVPNNQEKPDKPDKPDDEQENTQNEENKFQISSEQQNAKTIENQHKNPDEKKKDLKKN